MAIERDQAYYNEYYAESEEYRLPFNKSVYFPLWKRVLRLVPRVEIGILDVGCGSGQFGEMLCARRPNARYAGFDFSQEAVDIARTKIPGKFHYSLHVKSLYDHKYSIDEIVICLEVMEHVNDLKFLDLIPLGVEVIFSVPDFDQPSHVRYFQTVAQVVDRYKLHLNLSHVEKFDRWFICKGVRV